MKISTIFFLILFTKNLKKKFFVKTLRLLSPHMHSKQLALIDFRFIILQSAKFFAHIHPPTNEWFTRCVRASLCVRFAYIQKLKLEFFSNRLL